MADELRWEQLGGLVVDGQTSADAVATFRNTTDAMMFIRKINQSLTFSSADPVEFVNYFLSKARTAVGGNNEPGFNLITGIGVGSTGASPVDGTEIKDNAHNFAKGELTLEPNEAIFVNVTKSSGGAAGFVYGIGYHF